MPADHVLDRCDGVLDLPVFGLELRLFPREAVLWFGFGFREDDDWYFWWQDAWRD